LAFVADGGLRRGGEGGGDVGVDGVLIDGAEHVDAVTAGDAAVIADGHGDELGRAVLGALERHAAAVDAGGDAGDFLEVVDGGGDVGDGGAGAEAEFLRAL